MHIQAGDLELLVRAAGPDDDEFILDLASRFVDFELPKWRRRNVVLEGIRRDLVRHLEDQPPGSFLFVVEDDSSGERIGFLHLQLVTDFFTGHQNCHISDLAVVPAMERKGIGQALLGHAEQFARDHRCERLQLAVFPGNERARRIYEAAGYGVEMLRMVKPL
ncbi:GNAT family N-acetyltransferase [Pseudomarimonas salicorniae]|uniref:GNAT family N-acetyltransferase n=1 Tax=Pseudomarimonas salicorniae TaxID=2933270 RepID=A0ABT0GGM6_9GAMM|nr:GNAT family N-acetyltransferase [Lysobacter sp. CAU 1642]MCK7593686.1 GNAT family N-acetyltransferase [Lysobacter sp. CAU 1642]